MRYDRVASISGVVDLLYSAALLGIVAYTFRSDLRRVIDRRRAEFDAKRAEVADAKHRIDSRRGFVRYLRDRGIEPTARDLGMDAISGSPPIEDRKG